MAANAKEEKRRVGIFARIARSVRDMRGEMKRVVWPTKKQLLNNTGIVLVFMILAAILIGGFDTILSLLRMAFFGTAS